MYENMRAPNRDKFYLIFSTAEKGPPVALGDLLMHYRPTEGGLLTRFNPYLPNALDFNVYVKGIHSLRRR